MSQSNQEFNASIRSAFNQLAPTMDRWSARNRSYHQDLAQLHRFLIPSGAIVLEIGCGTGDLLAQTSPSFGVGIDFAAELIAQAQAKYPQHHFYCRDAAEDLKLETKFDYIIISDTLGHLSDIQMVLQQLQACCHPRTRIILTFHNFLWQPLLNLAAKIGQRRPQPTQSWLSMTDVLNLLSITGYESVKTGRRFLLPKAIPGLVTLCNRLLVHLPGIEHLGLTNYIVARPQVLVAADPQTTCTIVIPARNEAGNIAAAIARLPPIGAATEVIFVEGHSRDDTWAEIQRVVAAGHPLGHPRFTLKAMQQKGKGKADAVRLGFAAAGHDILMILDADLTVQPEDLPRFFEVVATGRGDFANGSRLVYPRSGAAMPWLNNWANKFFSLAFSFLLDQPLKDTLCGTKVLWREDYQKIVAGREYFGDFDPFGDFDLLFGAAKLTLKIVDIPLRYQPRTYGESNIAHVQEGLILVKMCLYASRKIKFF